MKRPEAQPLTLLYVLIKQHAEEKISPYEIMYGRPFQVLVDSIDVNQLGELKLRECHLSGKSPIFYPQVCGSSGTSTSGSHSTSIPTQWVGVSMDLELRTTTGEVERTISNTTGNAHCYQGGRSRLLNSLQKNRKCTTHSGK